MPKIDIPVTCIPGHDLKCRPETGAAQQAGSPRGGVCLEPGRETLFVELSTGHGEHDGNDGLFRSHDPQAVQAEEDVHGLERHALVAVYERVVVGQRETAGSGEAGEPDVRLVVESVSRSIKGGLEETAITKTESSTVGPDLVGVDGEDDGLGEPAGFVHLASSRIALR
jgi:hypothetical protein